MPSVEVQSWEYDLDGDSIDPLGDAVEWVRSLLDSEQLAPSDCCQLVAGQVTQSIGMAKPGRQAAWLHDALTRSDRLLLVRGSCPSKLLESFTLMRMPVDDWSQLQHSPWSIPVREALSLQARLADFEESTILGHDAQFILTCRVRPQ